MEAKLTYTNPIGKAVVFRTRRLSGGGHPSYVANYITGVGAPDVAYENMPITGSDGNQFGDPRYGSRIIQTQVSIYGRTDKERDRALQELIGILDPALGDGDITYQNHYGVYHATGRVKTLPSFGANSKIGEWKPVLIDYECEYPFWRGPQEYGAVVAASDRAFKLPFKLPFHLGRSTYHATVENKASVKAPVRMLVYGPAVDPSVRNVSTGQTIAMRKTIQEGEVLTIQTGPRILVAITAQDGQSTDALHYMNLVTSQWLMLRPGTNRIVYSSEDDLKNTRIELYWHDWYLGVG